MPEKSDVARPRRGQRVPSGPRPPSSGRSASSSLILTTIGGGASGSAHITDSERWVPDGEAGLTQSPPPASPTDSPGLFNPFDTPARTPPRATSSGPALSSIVSPRRDEFRQIHKQTSTPILSIKPKPKPLKVNTANLLPSPTSSPKKAVSPSLKHWQQVRSHVLATPLEEKVQLQTQGRAKGGLVGKAAAKLGFRQGSENAYGTAERKSTLDIKVPSAGGALSEAEKEEIARERRRFARDVKACLDACAVEETRRRLAGPRRTQTRDKAVHPPSGPSQASSSTFNPDFSAFAPLLTEMHRYLPAARAKKAWCRTCPHHDTILAELSTAFLPDGSSTSGERQQALEVFGVIVRSWAADGAYEELSRWLWLVQALKAGDRQLRNRGLMLLSSFLHHDPSLPNLGERPSSAEAFQAIAVGLLELLAAVEGSEYDASEHRQTVLGLLEDVVEGNVVELDAGLERSAGGSERELIWLALGRACGSVGMVEWLFAPANPILLRFVPPPLLHATPPRIVQLRAKASITLLHSLAIVIPSLPPATISGVCHTIDDLVIAPMTQATTDTAESGPPLGEFLVACLTYGNPPSDPLGDDDDPFVTTASASRHDRTYVEAVDKTLRSGGAWAKGVERALQRAVGDTEIGRTLALLDVLLSEKGLRTLAGAGVDTLLKRIEHSPQQAAVSRDFLVRLAKSHPQLYYKPLFSLAASTLPTTAAEHLRTVRTLASTTGPAHFWLSADPQMVAIVLMGDGTPPKSKGKGEEGVVEVLNVRIGRYAVLVEFLLELGGVEGNAKSGSRLRGFFDALELRLGAALQVQETYAALPESYRALICLMYYRLRTVTQSAKKAEWQRSILGWFFDSASAECPSIPPGQAGPLDELRDIYRSLAASSTSIPQTAKRKSTMATDITLQPPPIATNDPLHPLLQPNLLTSCTQLLVLLQSCWTLDDWGNLLPVVWSLLGREDSPTLPLIFLLQKCGEHVPDQLRTLVEHDLHSPSPVIRSSAIHKLATIYAYRHQVASQPTITSRRGPLFAFGHETLDFVITEIGSPMWSAPHDIKEEALQKYGANLPVEVRQRLMELGWSNDPGLKGDDGNVAEPISSLPIRHLLEDGDKGDSGKKGLGRHNSGESGSDSGTGKKTHRAVFAPVLWEVAGNQAPQALSADGGAASLSLELVRMLQRDEPNLFIRPFADHFSVAFRTSLSRLNAATIRSTPGSSYIAFNAIVGYLKHSLRQSPILEGYAYALTTLSSLVATVPEISLREIRKHKAEHVLLPASIHEEEGGFKVHLPWRDERVDVQSAQLLLVTEILRVNPRETHIIKRMMSNLQLQKSSLHDRTFARAWLGLIVTLFGLVSRTYNDRAELRHFLTTATVILRAHASDPLVVAQAMRLFMLCSARFRRLYAIMGFQATMRPIFDTYAAGNSATRDGIEYAMRSHYRIHQDSFVYQACLAISASEADPGAVYSLLSCLSEPNGPSSGTASGVGGLNDKEEHDALIQMLSGPEIALSELGKDRAERQAEKLAQAASIETRLFSKESIVRLYVTVIAANPPSVTAISMLNLFVGMVPHIKDEPSRKLLGEGVEALGGIISREKVDSASAGLAQGEETGGGAPDWDAAKVGYLRLVEAWMGTRGEISGSTTRTVLEMMLGLIRAGHAAVCPVGTAILRLLVASHLESPKPAVSLKATSAAFQAALGVLDVSGVLEALTAWIRQNDFDVGIDAARVIVEAYLGPAVRYVASSDSAGGERMRRGVVSLVAAAVLLPADAMGMLEVEDLTLGQLTHIIFPLVASFEIPTGVELEKRASALWLRVLHLMISPRSSTVDSAEPRSSALIGVLQLQVIKVICVRAPEVISSVRGLWSYIAQHLIAVIAQPNYRADSPVTLIDMMGWSLFELLALHRSPLMLHMRYHIQTALAGLEAPAADQPSVFEGSPSPSHRPGAEVEYHTGRIPCINRPSTLRPSLGLHNANESPLSKLSTRLSPSPEQPHRSDFLTPRLSPSPSDSSTIRTRGPRPSFTELSLRRSSRPGLEHPTGRPTGVGGTRFRFPSSADTRKIGGGGAIVHLLGASSGVAAATGGGVSAAGSYERRWGDGITRGVELASPELVRRVERSIQACRVIFGYPAELGEDEEPFRAWSVHDALLEVSEETRLLIEFEYADLFSGKRSGNGTASQSGGEGYGSEDLRGIQEHMGEGDEDEEPLLVR